ncbi:MULTISPECIES: rhodanese-like domain-containing protein [Streptomyces violaceusniger group]|uniref:thiosulfate sulfurtransferase n=2 Tax=Streptomyces rhizosphaericus TaxID=114699 RepID=A0ABP3ZZV8_9ACTN|nr:MULTISPECIES: rhodanese-like domain-containing protein [Streptomyces violaceusniger group]
MSATIPGSVDVPYPSMAHPGTSMLRTDQERKECLKPVPREQPVIVYCNSGLYAPLVGLSLLAAGYGEVKVYDGGLEEWLSDPHAPVEHRTTPV